MMKALLIFPFFYLKEIFIGALMVARDVILPQKRLAPILLHLPLEPLRPKQRLVLACLISMTPGTISISEKKQGKVMLVHSLYGGDDPEAAIEHLKNRYERIVSELPF